MENGTVSKVSNSIGQIIVKFLKEEFKLFYKLSPMDFFRFRSNLTFFIRYLLSFFYDFDQI